VIKDYKAAYELAEKIIFNLKTDIAFLTLENRNLKKQLAECEPKTQITEGR
jgi:hypothetical protein